MKTEPTEEEMNEIGGQLGVDLGLKRDKEHKDRWVTGWGTKTNVGLYRTIKAVMDNFRPTSESIKCDGLYRSE